MDIIKEVKGETKTINKEKEMEEYQVTIATIYESQFKKLSGIELEMYKDMCEVPDGVEVGYKLVITHDADEYTVAQVDFEDGAQIQMTPTMTFDSLEEAKEWADKN